MVIDIDVQDWTHYQQQTRLPLCHVARNQNDSNVFYKATRYGQL